MAFRLDLKNQNAVEWDFEKVIAQAAKVDPKKGAHWLTSVNWHEYPCVSYDNNGKDYLALFREPKPSL
mgnify:CR=1 FL=1